MRVATGVVGGAWGKFAGTSFVLQLYAEVGVSN